MNSFAMRRGWWLLALAAGSAAAMWAHAAFLPRLPRLTYLSGWALFLLMLILTCFNARKKLPFLPLLSSAAWLQFHIYAGWFSVVLFGLHLHSRLPRGWFEGTLALLYGLVTVSGIVGLILSRVLPPRLTTLGGEVPFERIRPLRHALKTQVEQLALGAIPESRSTILADFYLRRLKDFFDGPRHFWFHLLEVRRPLKRLLQEMNNLNRYLTEKERATFLEIEALVRQKDGLDYHRSLQLVLKGWLFVHIPLTYSLLLFTVAHLILVFAFSGGAG